MQDLICKGKQTESESGQIESELVHSASARSRAQTSLQALLDGKGQLLTSLVGKSKTTCLFLWKPYLRQGTLGLLKHFHIMLPSILAFYSNLKLSQKATFPLPFDPCFLNPNYRVLLSVGGIKRS